MRRPLLNTSREVNQLWRNLFFLSSCIVTISRLMDDIFSRSLSPEGHLMSTAEVEAALTEHPAVAEAAVVSRPHEVKGECLYCFVSLKDCGEFNRAVVEELKGLGEAQSHFVCSVSSFVWDLRFLDPKSNCHCLDNRAAADAEVRLIPEFIMQLQN